jgi:hypothetical protein
MILGLGCRFEQNRDSESGRGPLRLRLEMRFSESASESQASPSRFRVSASDDIPSESRRPGSRQPRWSQVLHAGVLQVARASLLVGGTLRVSGPAPRLSLGGSPVLSVGPRLAGHSADPDRRTLPVTQAQSETKPPWGSSCPYGR